MSLDLVGLLTRAGTGLTVETDSTLNPGFPLRVQPLAPDADSNAPPSLLTRLLRPRVVVRDGDAVLYTVAPGGNPEDGFPLGLVLAALAVAGGVVLFRWLRK